MRLEPPDWWFQASPTLTARALQPIASLVDRAAGRRWARAQPFRAPIPVVCVGNLTVGGAGKTPLAMCIGELLHQAGRRPGFLTRGYGGSRKGPHVVDPALDASRDVGDEALLLARAAPTVVARDRAAGARAFAGLPVDVIVMDDGLQNPQLAKSLSIAVLDPKRLIGNGLVMPAGPLREGLAAQLRRTDVLVVLCAPDEPLPELPNNLRALRAELTADPAVAGDLKGRRVVAYAGIGRPSKLFDTLRAAGADVTAEIPFPDHHRFNASDADRLIELAGQHRALLVTTQKDLARMAGDAALADLAAASIALPVVARFAGRDLERISTMIGLMLSRQVR